MDLSAHVQPMVDWLSQGRTEKSYCENNGIAHPTWKHFVSKSPNVYESLIRARAQGAWSEVDEAQQIADNKDINTNQARNMIDIRKWRAAKFMPKVFGEKLDIQVTERIDLIGVIEARKRRALQPLCNLEQLPNVQEAEYVGIAHSLTTDTESTSPGKDYSVFD